MWAVRPILAAQCRPQIVTDQVARWGCVFRAGVSLESLATSALLYLNSNAVLLEVLHTGVTDITPFRSVAGECLPVSWVYAGGLHVSLHLISVALQWATKESENRMQVPSRRQPSRSCCQAFYAHGQPSEAAPEEWRPLCRRCRNGLTLLCWGFCPAI